MGDDAAHVSAVPSGLPYFWRRSPAAKAAGYPLCSLREQEIEAPAILSPYLWGDALSPEGVAVLRVPSAPAGLDICRLLPGGSRRRQSPFARSELAQLVGNAGYPLATSWPYCPAVFSFDSSALSARASL